MEDPRREADKRRKEEVQNCYPIATPRLTVSKPLHLLPPLAGFARHIAVSGYPCPLRCTDHTALARCQREWFNYAMDSDYVALGLPQVMEVPYFSFWDFPRSFVANLSERSLFFRCDFDEQLDDYPSEFEVFGLNSKIEKGQLRFSDVQPLIGRKLGNTPADRSLFVDLDSRENQIAHVRTRVLIALLAKL